MPLTLHQPKAMVSIVDRPMIHYVIDEVVSAGIKKIVLVVGPHQEHFARYLNFLKSDPSWRNVHFKIAVQKKPLGNGHALLPARPFVGRKPFLLLFSDDILIPTKRGRAPLKELIGLFQKVRAPIVALEAIPRKEVSRYGVARAKKTKIHPTLYQLEDVIEKPSVKEAPSNLIAVGRYVITPEIMDRLADLYRRRQTSPRGEYELVDAFRAHLQGGGKMYGWRFPDSKIDCGSKLGILKAQVYFGLNHSEFGPALRQYLKKIGRIR